MTEPSALAAALAAFQANLPRVAKASQGNRGRYADLADVSLKVLPLLAAQGLAWTASPTVTDAGAFVLRYSLRHIGGEVIGGDYPLPNPNEPPQTLGSATTYAKRYALCAVTGVAPDNDDDDGAHATDNHHAQPSTQRQAPASNGTAKRTPAQVAAAFVTALLDVATPERAQAGLDKVIASDVAGMDVSGLMLGDDRETLGVNDGETCTLNELAVLVLGYVDRHGKSVRDVAVPA